jgi:uncharacterized protein (DUF1330 family)
MKAYLVANIRILDAEGFKAYPSMSGPTVERFGGRYLARGGRAMRLEGISTPERVAVLEFPSYEQAQRWWSSQEYHAARQLRQEFAATEMILVEGVE